MNWWAAIPAVMSIFGGIAGYEAGNDMYDLGKEQDLMAEENAILAKRELQETARRQEDDDRRLRASATARGAASGAEISGSIAGYIGYMEEEQGRQMDWLKDSGASRIRLDLQGAKMEARATKIRGKAQGTQALLGGFTQAFGYLSMGGAFESPTESRFIRRAHS